MAEIKRYNLMSIYSRREDEWAEMDDDPNGAWVRWEDVEKLLRKQEDNHAHETQLLTEIINRLVHKIFLLE